MNQDYLVNERIKASMVRLVLTSGEHVGVVSREDAIARAEQEGMDLVEISPEGNPPVCKLLDYGKFKYRRKKRLRQTHHKSQVKEIWIGPETEEHDLGFKAGRVQEFLQEHHKVRVTMRLTGRHKAHGLLVLDHMRIFGERVAEAAKVEQPPKRESSGRVSMLLSPK